MPNVYLSGSMLPESHGLVLGGLAVSVHKPVEVDGLIALCALAPRPPEDPLEGVFRTLSDPSLDLASWAVHWRELSAYRPADQTSAWAGTRDDVHVQGNEDMFPSSPLGKLRLALEAAQELWRAQQSEASMLSLVVLVAEPGNTGKGVLSLEGEGAALVIRPGSIVGEFVRLPLRLVGPVSWVLCFLSGDGTTPSARRPNMISRLRESAKRAGGAELTRIEEFARDKAPGRPLVVLLHGLFATDVGTFKGLQSELQKHFDVVGFPHDTLSKSIEVNGQELAGELLHLGYPSVYCVAHSRGGLVARSAAVRLAERGGNVAITRCVTFGTPHHGAELAENPESLIAMIAFLKASVRDNPVASIFDMLCCFVQDDSFPGIRDLRPVSTEEDWLYKLQDREEKLPPGTMMRLLAIGGTTHASGLGQRITESMARSLIGEVGSDLIVKESSSCPRRISNLELHREPVSCHHFSYFEDDQKPVFKKAIEFLLTGSGAELPMASPAP